MAFRLPDLICESIIRDGFANARRDDTIIDDVFGDLDKRFTRKKYGNKEIDKIKSIIENQEVSIVHSYNLVNANLPCISIQLADDREKTEDAHMGDYVHLSATPYSSPEDLASIVVIPAFTPTSYDPTTGIVVVPDSVDLSTIHVNLLFQDNVSNQFPILGGINNTPGSKMFITDTQATIVLGAECEIVSAIDYNEYLVHGNIEHTQLILGIHTKEALLTKYLYTLVKYFMLSRKKDMTKRGLQLDTYSGSDFHRNVEYLGDVVYSRFFNLSGIVQHAWRQDKVQLIDNVQVIAKVERDVATNEELGLTNSTIQVED
jgi:hypothetical protein